MYRVDNCTPAVTVMPVIPVDFKVNIAQELLQATSAIRTQLALCKILFFIPDHRCTFQANHDFLIGI